MNPVYNNSDPMEPMEPMIVNKQHNGRELPQPVLDACEACRTQYETLERFLIELASGGGVNMYGSPAYLSEMYGLTKREAREVVTYWMDTFTSAVIDIQ